MRLTDEQCDNMRRLPLSFNDMVRAIHNAGQVYALDEAAYHFENDYNFKVCVDGSGKQIATPKDILRKMANEVGK